MTLFLMILFYVLALVAVPVSLFFSPVFALYLFLWALAGIACSCVRSQTERLRK